MGVIAALFLVISGAAAVIGFLSAKSDIQLIIALVGLLFSGLFLALVIQSIDNWSLFRSIDRIKGAVEEGRNARSQLGQPRADAATEFNAALQLYQQAMGVKEPGHAIRDLAATALRDRGFLR